MIQDLKTYFLEKELEQRIILDSIYPAKNKFSSKHPYEKRHWDSLFARNLRANKSNFGTNYKPE